jgi:hypothetical protein
MSANVLLAWPNYIEEVIDLYGGSYRSTLPLSNVKDRVFAKKARTTDTEEVNTQFNVTLKGTRGVNVVSIASHNFTTSAQIRIRFYSDVAQGSLLFDTGYIDVWPSIYSSEQLEWEYTNYWEGTISQEDLDDFTPLFSFVTTQLIIPVSIKVEIRDTANMDGYLEFGRVFLGEAFQPNINMEFGAQIGYSINTEIEQAQDNTEYYDRKRPRRTVSFVLNALTQDEAFSKVYTLQRTQGIDKEVFFVYKNQQDAVMFSRTFIGRLQQPDPISQPYFDRYSAPINIIEII